MNLVNRERFIVIGLLIFLSITIIVGIFINSYTYRLHRIDKIHEMTYSLPQTYTLEQAKKAGIVDVSLVSNGRNVKIEKFLGEVSQNKPTILRTAKINNDGELIITLYTNITHFQTIRVYEYNVVYQRVDGTHASQEYKISNSNGVNEVWLVEVPPPEYYIESYDESEFSDLLLYSWE